jgi:amino-acid N-acetyltransferase
LLKTRKAKVSDIKKIHRSLNAFAKKGLTLPRPLNELYEHVRDFYICEDSTGILGFCALHLLWEDLGEIRSLIVTEESRKQGIGKILVSKCIGEAKRLGLKRVFALTYTPDFFKKIGFGDIDKSKLPHKIWGDCMRCPKFPECDEFAVIKNV